jgi:hypothetical protein
VHERVALPRFFRFEVLADLEVANRAGEARRERSGVEVLDRSDAADAIAHVLPAVGNRVTDRRN